MLKNEDRPRLNPRHIRKTLPLLPSGPGGVHVFKIARRPEPDMLTSRSEIGKRQKMKMAERGGLEPPQAFRPAALPTRCHTIRRPLRNSAIPQLGASRHERNRWLWRASIVKKPARPGGRAINWRRGWDSNPRYPSRYNGFRDRPIQPLSHLSVSEICVLYVLFIRSRIAAGPERSSA